MNRFFKFLFFLSIVFTSFQVYGEGYQVNTLSARQNGMGHTGTAMKLGAESMIFNPAGLGYLENNIEFQGSLTSVFADAKATLADASYKTSNTPSTPMAFNLAMSVYNNLKVGISFYTPYGSGINWGDNWPGAVLNQRVALKSFTLQPTVAYRILNNLSVGVGAMVTFGNVNLDKGLVTPSSMNIMLSTLGVDYRFTDTPASINLQGKAATTVGVNVGAMWDIDRRWTVGVSFRSKMNLKVKCGDASVRYANDISRNILENQLGILDQANFQAAMPAVAILNFGISYRPIEQLIIAADAQWNGWSAYKSLDIEFLSEALVPFNQYIIKDYKNSWTFHAGCQYDITHRFQVRGGLMIDTTPVNKKHYNPETPGMTKIEPSVGFSFSPVKNFSIDASVLYVAGLGVDKAGCTYNDLILKKDVTFIADYSVYAWNPSLGFRLNF